MPCTSNAVEVLQAADVLFAAGKAAKTGGVATSVLEIQQNASCDSWTFHCPEERRDRTMCNIGARSTEEADTSGYMLGADIAGIIRVAEATRLPGVV